MATKVPYSKWGLAAIIGGVALTAIEVIGAVGYLVGQDQPSYLGGPQGLCAKQC